MTSILTLTNNLSYLNSTNKKILVLNKIFDLKKNENLNYKNIQVIKNNFKDKKELIDAYEYCNNIYVKLLKDLTIELNRTHGLKKSTDNWEVIIGKWLLEFIYISHKNFLLCKKILLEKKLSHIIMINSEDYSLHTKETEDLLWARNDSDWNLSLNSKIINFLDTEVEKKYLEIKNKKFTSDVPNSAHVPLKNNKTTNIFFFIKNKILKIINKINNKKNILIYLTSLSLIQEKKLELLLGQIPKFWPKEVPKYNKNYDYNLRKKISLKKDTEDKFESFIRLILPDALPLFVLESFKDLEKQMTDKNFPNNPSKVFTCYGYAYDELFKIYLSKIKEKKIPIYIGQHGNNYFTLIYSKYFHEFNICDKFISWGAKDNKKIVQGFNFNTLNKQKDYKINGNLLIVCGSVGIDHSPLERNIRDEKSADVVIDLIKRLEDKKNFIKIRLHATHFEQFNGYYYQNYFKNLDVEKDLGKKNIFKLIKKSRVVFFNYDSTGLLENLSLNIPSVCFWQDTYLHIDEQYINKYKKLVEAKILFENFEDLIAHLNKYWDNIDQWWLSPNTQNIVREFNKDLNINSQKLTDLVKILKI